MTGLRIGSLCSGYEGISMAVREVLGGELAFVADIDPGACKILAHRFPGVPNLGDVTTADWSAAEPVDILTGGFPCQPVSTAGRRAGTEDERCLFDDICTAIGRMESRPRLLVFENVAGLLTANGGDAMARVVHGLGSLGYVGHHRLLRASDVGAPHRRERVFITAWPAADTAGGGCGPRGGRGNGRAAAIRGEAIRWTSDSAAQDSHRAASGEWRQPAPGQAPGGWSRADAGGSGGAPAAADAQGDRWHQGRPESARILRGPDAALGCDEPSADAERDGREGRQQANGTRPASVPCGPAGSSGAPADAAGLGRRPEPGQQCGLRPAEHQPGDIAWGPYAPAIARWEAVTGRPAPRPTEPGRSGERLSPSFVEWLMGLPAGWVTGVPGLSRNQQLHALGNGVVPQQAEMALRLLLPAAGISWAGAA